MNTIANIERFKREGSGVRSKFAPDLNRTKLGKAIGISRPHMSRILSGEIQPTMRTLRKMANVLGTSVDVVDEFLADVKAAANGKGRAKKKGKGKGKG